LAPLSVSISVSHTSPPPQLHSFPSTPLSRSIAAAVILDINLRPGFLNNLPDGLAAGANHIPDPVGVDLHDDHPRCVWRKIRAGLGDRLFHLLHDKEPSPSCLFQGLLENFLPDPANLDTHLDG